MKATRVNLHNGDMVVFLCNASAVKRSFGKGTATRSIKVYNTVKEFEETIGKKASEVRTESPCYCGALHDEWHDAGCEG